MLDRFKEFFSAGGVEEIKPTHDVQRTASLGRKTALVLTMAALFTAGISSHADAAGLTFVNGKQVPNIEQTIHSDSSPMDLFKHYATIVDNNENTEYVDPLTNRKVNVVYDQLEQKTFEKATKGTSFYDATYYDGLTRTYDVKGFHYPVAISLKDAKESIILMSDNDKTPYIISEKGTSFHGTDLYAISHEGFHIKNALQKFDIQEKVGSIGGSIYLETHSDIATVALFEAAAHEDIDFVRKQLGLDDSYKTPKEISTYLADQIISSRNFNDVALMLKRTTTDYEHFTQGALEAYKHVDFIQPGMTIEDIDIAAERFARNYIETDYRSVYESNKDIAENAVQAWELQFGTTAYPVEITQSELIESVYESFDKTGISMDSDAEMSPREVLTAKSKFKHSLEKLRDKSSSAHTRLIRNFHNHDSAFWNNLRKPSDIRETVDKYIADVAAETRGVEGYKGEYKISNTEIFAAGAVMKSIGTTDSFIKSLGAHYAMESNIPLLDVSSTAKSPFTALTSVTLKSSKDSKSSFEARIQAEEQYEKDIENKSSASKDSYEPN